MQVVNIILPRTCFILYNQYHGCWWPGIVRSQGISRHSTGLVLWNILPLKLTELKGLTKYHTTHITIQPSSKIDIFYIICTINSLRPCDILTSILAKVASGNGFPSGVMMCQRSWSKLGQVMAWCQMALRHYMIQFWLIGKVIAMTISNVSKILRNASQCNFYGNSLYIYHQYIFQLNNFECAG